MRGLPRRRVTLGRAGVVFAAAAVAGLTQASTSVEHTAGTPCTPRATAAYTARVTAALRANRDVWGEALLSARGGPTFEAAAARLAPIFYARAPKGRPLTESGAYYVPFGMPAPPGGAATVMLHVADGSQILARRVEGPSIRVSVGKDGRERYGSCLARLTPARLADALGTVILTSKLETGDVHVSRWRVGGSTAHSVPLQASSGTNGSSLLDSDERVPERPDVVQVRGVEGEGRG